MESCSRGSSRFIILALIVLAGALLRAICFGGFSGSDDGSYTELAFDIAGGRFGSGAYDGPPVFPLRLGLIWPVGALIGGLGLSEAAIVAYPFAVSVAGVLMAYAAGAALFNARAGLIAAAIQALVPIDVRLASILLPDMIAAFWANAALLLLYFGSGERSNGFKLGSGALAGLLMGVSWLCKESVIYLFPFIGICLLVSAYRRRTNIIQMFAFGAGFAAVFGLECLHYYNTRHDLLFRFHEIERNYVLYKAWFFAEGSKYGWRPGESYYFAVFKRLVWQGPRTIFLNTNLGLVTVTAMAAVAMAVIRKRREFLLPAALFLYLLFIYNFGTTSFKFYQPLALLDRYLFPLLLPAALLTAAAIDHALAQGAGRKATALTGAVLAAVFVLASAYNHAWNLDEGTLMSAPERTVAGMIGPDETVYTDSRTPRVLRFFWGYPERTALHDFSGMQAGDVPEGALVFINRKKAGFLNSWYGYELPEFYDGAPGGWKLEWKGPDAELYRVPAGGTEGRG